MEKEIEISDHIKLINTTSHSVPIVIKELNNYIYLTEEEARKLAYELNQYFLRNNK